DASFIGDWHGREECLLCKELDGLHRHTCPEPNVKRRVDTALKFLEAQNKKGKQNDELVQSKTDGFPIR
ncbi:hypothetical protein, partial [Propionibacterium freudenreichii]|uniref:hypothetical protein n=1 Tax=Propionibacterium freudenreichii TaxID=1744 RepID=UPI003853B49C